ncbi:hypothetical protein WG899_14785 [Paucibacter sp. AS339]|uniref:hypothetical protein n=1 Tax=Paucibacter hankyongi TaxID=3133434 RepID=UPI0030B06410
MDTQYMQSKSPQTQPNNCLGTMSNQFELRFQSLFHSGKALSFPCDSRGDVLLDSLSAKALENYLFARAVVGHEYANPVVQPLEE